MTKGLIRLALVLAIVGAFVPRLSYAQTETPRIYIAPSDGFESYLAAAFTKKHVPAQIVQDKDNVKYILSSPPVQEKPESAGGKIARCLFAYCAGIEGSQCSWRDCTHTLRISQRID